MKCGTFAGQRLLITFWGIPHAGGFSSASFMPAFKATDSLAGNEHLAELKRFYSQAKDLFVWGKNVIV